MTYPILMVKLPFLQICPYRLFSVILCGIMSQKKTSRWRTFGMITVIFAVILCYGIALALFGMTLVNPWLIMALSLALAGISVFFFKNKRNWSVLTGTASVPVNVICHLVAATGLFMALILGVNYFCRDTSHTVTVRAEIVRIYSETRYRSKRVARNRYTRGEPYKVYFMDARLPDGRECKRSISIQRYNRYARSSHRHQPDSVDLHLTSGALGMEIIER